MRVHFDHDSALAIGWMRVHPSTHQTQQWPHTMEFKTETTT